MSLKSIDRKPLFVHLGVILIFFILTAILTLPVIVNFGTEFAGTGPDIWNNVWKWWWTKYAFDNNLDWLKTDYIFYPTGVNVGKESLFTMLFSYVFQFLDYVQIWNVLWFGGFVFGGYGAFLLAYHFNKNFIASLAAGAIFTFSTYHTTQAVSHVDLAFIVWIPLSILFLFKMIETKSKINPVLVGVFLSLAVLTQLTYAFVMVVFVFLFSIVYFIRKKNISNKTLFIHFLIAGSIFFILSSPMLLTISSALDEEPYKRPISEINIYSANIENVFLIPSSLHSIHHVTGYAFGDYIYSMFGTSYIGVQMEQVIFLGITPLVLAGIAIVWFRNKHFVFWIITLLVFAILTLGPELRSLNELTGYVLPGKVLYDSIPGWDFNRVPARFVVMVTLSLAVLSAHAVDGITKQRIKSSNKAIALGVGIMFFILLEFSVIPYPTTAQEIPLIYDTIKKDTGKFAILEAPTGGQGYLDLQSDPLYQYFQTVHEKPIFGGWATRPSTETERFLQSYFFLQFFYPAFTDDIIKQDLGEVGISILNHYNIGYVILHKKTELVFLDEHIRTKFVPTLKQQMNKILNQDSPFYEDSDLVVYKIPKSDSKKPFILLGDGWDDTVFSDKQGSLVRLATSHSEIIIINPSSETQNLSLQILLSSTIPSNQISVSFSNKILLEKTLSEQPTDILIENLVISTGKNIISLDASEFKVLPPLSNIENEREMSIVVDSISFV
ncbi:MAG: hypothetical protein ACT4OW_01830 [Nitrososphaerota archaeon]